MEPELFIHGHRPTTTCRTYLLRATHERSVFLASRCGVGDSHGAIVARKAPNRSPHGKEGTFVKGCPHILCRESSSEEARGTEEGREEGCAEEDDIKEDSFKEGGGVACGADNRSDGEGEFAFRIAPGQG